MQEVYGDIWTYPADLFCITTNGDINGRGEAVMGRGVALQAKQRFPEVQDILAIKIRRFGNRVHDLGHWAPFSPASSKPGHHLASFPVKNHWGEKANLALIRVSCFQLLELVEKLDKEEFRKKIQTVIVPRPGCGNGQLDWETEVQPVCLEVFGKDDRFHFITDQVQRD